MRRGTNRPSAPARAEEDESEIKREAPATNDTDNPDGL
eukprot:CAMPEP_0113326956 /NCGR_PEP_ID=MMETSP0010_2-20120614/18919_1 /TAXON_ID=216773 ORGANISM="Corethron hystrix, Strain 308" /NCGR_SAMPLE_ID=MMETSP0010_2 /ASSEMBLY_ACC=CAM_ASM_000155 /LENGTH=37 /DNA_ID=CAMNT_0000187565 /DNA_START=683 /DNA_END=793 /DNA_ORIENTATION=- /assembly_acc=CAM_ASM_000155